MTENRSAYDNPKMINTSTKTNLFLNRPRSMRRFFNHRAKDHKTHNCAQGKLIEKGPRDKGIGCGAYRENESEEHHQQEGYGKPSAGVDDDILRHHCLKNTGEQGSGDKVAAHVKKFSAGMAEDCLQFSPDASLDCLLMTGTAVAGAIGKTIEQERPVFREGQHCDACGKGNRRA